MSTLLLVLAATTDTLRSFVSFFSVHFESKLACGMQSSWIVVFSSYSGSNQKNTHFIWWNVAVDGGEKTNVAQNQTKSKTFWSKKRNPTATLCHTAKRSFLKFWLGFVLETQLGCDNMTSVYSFRTRLPHKPEHSKSQPSPASKTQFCKAFWVQEHANTTPPVTT